MASQPVVPGGYTGPYDADKEVQKICDDMKSAVERRTEMNYRVFQAVQYMRSRDIAGIIYLIKVHVGEDKYIVIYVFQALGGALTLEGVQQGKTRTDPIEPPLTT